MPERDTAKTLIFSAFFGAFGSIFGQNCFRAFGYNLCERLVQSKSVIADNLGAACNYYAEKASSSTVISLGSWIVCSAILFVIAEGFEPRSSR